MGTKAKILARGIVAARPGQMYAWPGIARLKNGEILVSASERTSHICPLGREVVIRSLDGGRSWQLPQEVYNSELDDRDSNLAVLPDGTVILTWFTSDAFTLRDYAQPKFQPRIDRVTKRMRAELCGSWLLRSFDGGHAWEDTPRPIPAGCHAGPTVLSDGAMIYLGVVKSGDSHEMSALVSRDAGISWEKKSEIATPKRTWKDEKGHHLPIIDENHVLELSPGRLLALFRADGPGEGFLYQSNSEDGGASWSPIKKLPVAGLPPHLLRLHSGAIFCSYAHRRNPWSVRAVLSYDDGRSWDVENIITLDAWDDKPDMGYPVSLEVTPGEIVTVYYCARKTRKWVADEEKLDKKGSTPEGLLYTRLLIEG